MKQLMLLVLITVVPTLVAQQQMAATPLPNYTCTGISNVDFRNLKFESKGRFFAFHKGKAYNWECPECGVDRDNPDWEAEIEQDKVINPAPSIRIRFLLVHDDHLRGTGWWYHVIGFQCEATGSSKRGGRLLKVFDRQGMSLQPERIDDQGITVTAATVPGKSLIEHFAYRWDNSSSRFVLARTWTTRMRIP